MRASAKANSRIIEASAASCPRCGYNLLGAAASWKDACPLGDVCSECGLHFEWADILRNDRRAIPWLYEHQLTAWRPRSAIITALRAAIPWSFWKRVNVHARIVPHRLAMWLICLFAMTCFATLLPGLGFGAAFAIIPPPAFPARVLVRSPGAVGVTAAVITSPRTILVWSGPDAITIPVPPPGPTPTRVETTFGPVIFHDLDVWPWPTASASPGAIILGIRVVRSGSGPSPADIAANAVLGPFGLGPALGMRTDHFRPPVLALTPPAFAIPAAFVVLACSSEWQRARVRTLHLLRICVYSLLPMFAIAILSAATWALELSGAAAEHFSFGGPRLQAFLQTPQWLLDLPVGFHSLTVLVILTAWMSLSWWCGLRFGLSLRRSGWLCVFITVAGGLGEVNLLAAIWAYTPAGLGITRV